MLPQSNANLVSITRGGYTEDYDRTSGASAPVWQGNIDAYVQRKFVSTFNDAGELKRVMQVTLYVSQDIPVILEPGDVVTYSVGNPDAPSTLAGIVQTGTDPAYMAQLPDYYKFALEETNVP